MSKILVGVLSLAVAGLLVLQVNSQPPGGKDGPPKFGKPKLGMVLPPHIRGELNLTEDQKKQLRDLEDEVQAKLKKILTADQIKKVEEAFKKGPPGKGGPGGKDGPPGKGRPDDEGPGGKNGKPEPRDEPVSKAATPTAKIQWYATLEGGLEQARQSGKPILLVSAAPHCAGVSGIW